MVYALIWFLICVVVLAVVVYVAKIFIDYLTLPPQIKQIAYVVLGVVALIVLLLLVLRFFGGPAAALP